MSVILGNNLILAVDGKAVAGSKSCTLNVQSGTIEIASPQTGTWRQYIRDRREWSVDCSYLMKAVGSDGTAFTAYVNKMLPQIYGIEFPTVLSTGNNDGKTLLSVYTYSSGTWSMSSWNINGSSAEDVATFVAQLQSSSNEGKWASVLCKDATVTSDMASAIATAFGVSLPAGSTTITVIAGAIGSTGQISVAGSSDNQARIDCRVLPDATIPLGIFSHPLGLLGKEVTLRFSLRDGSEEVMTGTALCVGWKVTASMSNLVQGAFQFKGNGQLIIDN